MAKEVTIRGGIHELVDAAMVEITLDNFASKIPKKYSRKPLGARVPGYRGVPIIVNDSLCCDFRLHRIRPPFYLTDKSHPLYTDISKIGGRITRSFIGPELVVELVNKEGFEFGAANSWRVWDVKDSPVSDHIWTWGNILVVCPNEAKEQKSSTNLIIGDAAVLNQVEEFGINWKELKIVTDFIQSGKKNSIIKH